MKRCSFCARQDGEVQVFLEGDRATICDVCIDNAKQLVDNYKAEQELRIIETEKAEAEAVQAQIEAVEAEKTPEAE